MRRSWGERRPIELGTRARAERHRLGWSQMELGEAAGLYFSVISEIELGKHNLTLATMLKVADALGINPAVLVDGLKPPPTPRKPKRLQPTSWRRRPAYRTHF